MNVSVVIPHKGREKLLLETVKSILKQISTDLTYEIIIVTQNVKLDLGTVITEFANIISVHHISDRKSISYSRNYGAMQAKGDYLAFLDADVELSEYWFLKMIESINQDPKRIIVSSIQRNCEQAPDVERVRTALNNLNTDTNVDSLPGSNLFIRRGDFESSVKFPEQMKTCEDIYFTSELAKKGDLHVTGNVSHVHLGEDKSYRQLFGKEIWRGQSNLQSIKGRVIPMRELPSFIIPIMITALLLVAVLTLFLGYYLLAGTSLFLLLIPVFAYSVRLYSLSKSTIEFWPVFKFYLVYFPARAFGTFSGLIKSLTQ